MHKHYDRSCKQCGKSPIRIGEKIARGAGKDKKINHCCTCGKEQ